MSQFRVLVPDVQFPELDIERAVTGNAIQYNIFHETDAGRIPDDEWRNCDAVLIWHRMKLTADVVARLDKCRMVVRVGVGFDNVDTAACSRRGIPVSNVPNYGTTEVADHALALLLNLVRGIEGYQARLRRDLADGFVAEDAPVVRRIRGSTFGAIGMGRIGTAVARRASAFDMRVIFYDPYLSEGCDLALGYERVRSMPELLARSDIVSLHTPLTAETRGFIDAAALSHMKPNAILINIARGGLIDLDALYHALRGGKLAAAGLDVLPQEPPNSAMLLVAAWQKNEPWLDGRLAITPHAAFYSEAGYVDMRTFSAEILSAYLTKNELRNNVNPDWKLATGR